MTNQLLRDERTKNTDEDEFIEELKKMGFKPGGIRYDEVTGERYETWVSDLTDKNDDDCV